MFEVPLRSKKAAILVLAIFAGGCGSTQVVSRAEEAKIAHHAQAEAIAEAKTRLAKERAANPIPKRPHPHPRKPKPLSDHLTSEGWKQLGKELYFTLEVGGGTRMLAALRQEATGNCRSEEPPCYHEIGSTMVQRMTQARTTVQGLESNVLGSLCREALEQVYRTFDAPLLRAEEFKAGHVSGSYTEFLWEETERELEGPLTIEHGEEGRSQLVVRSLPLANCDPSGSGRIVLG